MLAERGERWVHAADEFYLVAGSDLPTCEEYDGFPQFENGIGMTRSFVNDFRSALSATAGTDSRRREKAFDVTLLTGTLFAPVLRTLASELQVKGVRARVLPVENAFLGGNVSVAGLLSGADLIDAVVADGARGTYLLPDVAVNSDGLTIDGLSAADLCSATGATIELVSADASGFIESLSRLKGAA
jgi:NifB/MoaA-like Fe-S oxidoreductase